MKTLRLSWQGFWARRSRARIVLTGLLMALTLLAIVWLVLPSEWQRQARSGSAFVARWVSSLDTRTLLVALIGLCFVEGLALLFVPSYRKHGYLATAPSLIPLVSVYLDGENQHPERAIKPFMLYLKKRLNGSRADLLYFQRATTTARTAPYRTLRLSGFQPIDVPHDPTGKSTILEAVDREIAMHAFERALLGPEKQLFIIISQDGDYVPLIYRLVALGHHVEVWALRPAGAYSEAQKYINTVPDGPGDSDDDYPPLKVIDLVDEIPAFKALVTPTATPGSQPVALPTATLGNQYNMDRPRYKPYQKKPRYGANASRRKLTIPATISNAGEEAFYRAIVRTIEIHKDILGGSAPQAQRNTNFRGMLGLRLKSLLVHLGYGDGTGTSLKYWLKHLRAVHVFIMPQEDSFPDPGDVAPDDAARRMFAMAQVAANAAVSSISGHGNGIIGMHEVANALAATRFSDNDLALSLIRLMSPDNANRTTHVRYFIHSARALGLLAFEDVPGKLDEIMHPQLPKSDPASDELSGEADVAHADTTDTDNPEPAAGDESPTQ